VPPQLTAKQRAFVLEYPRDFNATKAAIRAGFSAKTARQVASQLLTKPNISKLIDQEFEKRSLKLDEILARLTEQATTSIGDFMVVNPDGNRIAFDPEIIKERGHLIKRIKAISTVRYSEKGEQYEYTTLSLELYNAQKALDLLGRHRGMAAEVVQHTGEINIKVTYQNDRSRPHRHAQAPARPATPVH